MNSKCTKWIPGKKSAIGDKPAVKRNEQPISWDRLPFATKPLETSADVDQQQNAVSRSVIVIFDTESLKRLSQFLELWSEDGTTAEVDPDLLE